MQFLGNLCDTLCIDKISIKIQQFQFYAIALSLPIISIYFYLFSVLNPFI